MSVHIPELNDDALTRARGQYATLRVELDARMKRVGELTEVVRQVLYTLHKDLQTASVDDVHARVEEAKSALNAIVSLSIEVIDIAQRRAELKPIAWGQS